MEYPLVNLSGRPGVSGVANATAPTPMRLRDIPDLKISEVVGKAPLYRRDPEKPTVVVTRPELVVPEIPVDPATSVDRLAAQSAPAAIEYDPGWNEDVFHTVVQDYISGMGLSDVFAAVERMKMYNTAMQGALDRCLRHAATMGRANDVRAFLEHGANAAYSALPNGGILYPILSWVRQERMGKFLYGECDLVAIYDRDYAILDILVDFGYTAQQLIAGDRYASLFTVDRGLLSLIIGSDWPAFNYKVGRLGMAAEITRTEVCGGMVSAYATKFKPVVTEELAVRADLLLFPPATVTTLRAMIK